LLCLYALRAYTFPFLLRPFARRVTVCRLPCGQGRGRLPYDATQHSRGPVAGSWIEAARGGGLRNDTAVPQSSFDHIQAGALEAALAISMSVSSGLWTARWSPRFQVLSWDSACRQRLPCSSCPKGTSPTLASRLHCDTMKRWDSRRSKMKRYSGARFCCILTCYTAVEG
jgi:hypothetical protein